MNNNKTPWHVRFKIYFNQWLNGTTVTHRLSGAEKRKLAKSRGGIMARLQAQRRATFGENKDQARCININIPVTRYIAFGTNKIQTTKYSAITFLPKNIIYEQFKSIANIYFLIMIMLQKVPGVGNTNFMVAISPLVVILLMTAAKAGFEDWKRHASDKAVNDNLVLILDKFINVNMKNAVANKATGGQTAPGWKKCYWKDLRVGDIVRIENNQPLPADLVILSTSEPDGLCYVETKNLDGETNLKIRRCIIETSHIKTHEELRGLKCIIETEEPNSHLYSFNGKLILYDENNQPKQPAALTINNILLRGSILRNTAYIYAIVVSTGFETKLMLNSGPTPSKRSRIERRLNPHIVLNFLIIVIIGLIGSGLYISRIESYLPKRITFLPSISDYSWEYVLNFLATVAIFQNMIPLSLYVSLEMCKGFHAFLISSDVNMYYEPNDTPCIAQSWNLSDDLGQIEYVFSDKTGTLTRNVMELRKISVNGIVYGYTEVDLNKPLRRDEFTSDEASILSHNTANNPAVVQTIAEIEARTKQEMKKMFNNRPIADTLPLADPTLFAHLSSNADQSRNIIEFFRILVVCHTVLSQKSDSEAQVAFDENIKNMNYLDIVYKAQSPDEAALVSAARSLGFSFICRDKDIVYVDILGKLEKYKILNVIEFNSTRKRMSVIFQKANGEIVLYCKGADSIIFERLAKVQGRLETETSSHLESFAEEGLRTLCLAYRIIGKEEYQEWSELYAEASSTLQEREEKMDKVAELIEKKLLLVGSTAIEDKLQEGVPETIEILARAGIKLWVLTGDKMETAISIGFSCNLLDRDMLLVVIKGFDEASTLKQIKDAMDQVWGNNESEARAKLLAATSEAGLERMNNKNVNLALIIDGSSLKYALDAACRPYFLELGCRCKAVICCKVSPLQKAKVVELVRNGKQVMTLAIGDGANDVSMIQAADIGVGISGEEGVQAVMASDYAIAQFKFLRRLLLVHGRYSYLRISNLALSSFYKNFIFALIPLWYQFYSLHSGTLSYDVLFQLYFNLLYCNIPSLAIGMLDIDISQYFAEEIPQMYMPGINQTLYNSKILIKYYLLALYQSLVCYYIVHLAFADAILPNGFNADFAMMGIVGGFTGIILCNICCAWMFYSINWISCTCLVIGNLIILVLVLLMNFSYSVIAPTLYGSLSVFASSPLLYLGIILSIAVSMAPPLIYSSYCTFFYPTDMDVLRESMKFNIRSNLIVESAKPKSYGSIDALNLMIPERTLTKIEPVAHMIPIVEEETPTLIEKKKTIAPFALGKNILGKATSILYMRTGKFEKLRGFAFAQEEGMRDLLTGKAFGVAVQSRPEIELTKLGRAAIKDSHRYPRGVSTTNLPTFPVALSAAPSVLTSSGGLTGTRSKSNNAMDTVGTSGSGAMRPAVKSNAERSRDVAKLTDFPKRRPSRKNSKTNE